MSNQKNANQSVDNRKVDKSSVTHTLIEVEPTAAVYNLDSDDIQSFVQRYFDNEGVKGLEAVRLLPIRQDKRSPEAKVYAIFDSNSSDTIKNKNNNVPLALQQKMDQGGARLSSKVYNAVKPLIQGKPVIRVKNSQGQRLIVVELDIFLVVGMMLAARPGVHELAITEVKAYKHSTVITVIKTKAFNKRGGQAQSDRYMNILSNM